MINYGDFDRAELEARLAAAEAVCLMHAWTGSHETTDRDKALYMLWRHWWDMVPAEQKQRSNHPELDDVAVFAMAVERDLIRDTTLRRIRGEG